MVIMALDHVRDYFFKTTIETAGNVATDPTNMETTFPALFFTRWITHFCAPVFVFLAGTSIYFMGMRRSRKQISAFVFKRGIWLIAVEVVLITLAWTFNPLFNVIILQVIWAIGISMVLMSAVIYLPLRYIFVIGSVIVLGHNMMDYASVSASLRGTFLSDLIYFAQFAFYPLSDSRFVLIVYSFLPWLGVMMVGYCFGRWYGSDMNPRWRRRALITTGLMITALFIVLRSINAYGDPFPWEIQSRGETYTFLSFLNTTKYPPSLLFLTMTLGPSLVLLAFIENASGRVARFFNVFGRVPLLYYIIHLYLIHILVVIVFFLQGHPTSEIVSPNNPFLFRPNDFGFGLAGVYGMWFLTILILYPICKKYDGYKQTSRKWWVSYL